MNATTITAGDADYKVDMLVGLIEPAGQLAHRHRPRAACGGLHTVPSVSRLMHYQVAAHHWTGGGSGLLRRIVSGSACMLTHDTVNDGA